MAGAINNRLFTRHTETHVFEFEQAQNRWPISIAQPVNTQTYRSTHTHRHTSTSKYGGALMYGYKTRTGEQRGLMLLTHAQHFRLSDLSRLIKLVALPTHWVVWLVNG